MTCGWTSGKQRNFSRAPAQRGPWLPGGGPDRGLRRRLAAGTGAALRHEIKRRRREVRVGEDGDKPGDAEQPPEVVVMASGCLGLVSFPREPGRMTLEQLERCYPRVVPALVEHPGIGFVLVRSERSGALAIGARGVHHLDEQRVEGEDPLAPFGPNAARHLRHTDGFPHCADIMVNSAYWAGVDEVAAFEELVGSHGGMGGGQSFPFVLHPGELELPEEEIVGPEALHRHFRRWLVELGHEEYAVSSAAPRSP